MGKIRHFIAAGALAGALAVTGCAGTVHGVYVEDPPPVAEVDVRTDAPYAEAVWVPGYYDYVGGHYLWRRGHYERARPGYSYEPHRWVHEPRGWTMRRGGWYRVR